MHSSIAAEHELPEARSKESELHSIIEVASFTEHDVDMGTSGLCGTFALAMKSAFPHLRLGLLCLNGENGHPQRGRSGGLLWRHAVVIEGDQLFDIEGRVLLDDIIENHCWNNPYAKGGQLVLVEEGELLRIVMEDNKSFDQLYFDRWSRMLSQARMGFSVGSSCTTSGIENEGRAP